MKKKELISIIIPCFNEEEAIPFFYQKMKEAIKDFKNVNFEFIFIDDGSTDNTPIIFKKLRSKDKKVRYITFSRNFGKEASMFAGLEHSRGDYLAIMDADLQDPPEFLTEMYKTLKKEEYDCVALYTKSHEGYGFIRRTFTNLWYKIIEKISDSKQVPGARDFRLMTRQVADSIISMKEYNRYTKGMFGFVGFNTKWIAYDAPKRKKGKSKFNAHKLIKYALDGIVAYSTSLLTISAYLGLLFCLVSFLALLVIIIKTMIWGDPVSGWPSLASLIVFIGGVQLFFLGVIGVYLSKIYLEVKHRPIYIIKETEESKNEK